MMSSLMPFTFNAIDLYNVTINGKSWNRERGVCETLKYSNNNKKTAHVIKGHCNLENSAQKHLMSGLPMARTPVESPKDLLK